jgi:signal transduction histidine kinase
MTAAMVRVTPAPVRVTNLTPPRSDDNPTSWETATVILADEAMIVTGTLGCYYVGFWRWAFFSFALVCFAFVEFVVLYKFLDITFSPVVHRQKEQMLFFVTGAASLLSWNLFWIVDLLGLVGAVDAVTCGNLMVICDFGAKLVYVFILSSSVLRLRNDIVETLHKEAKVMSEMQRTFFFNITHELRTPLNAVIGFNSLVSESGELNELHKGFVDGALTAAEALLSLINQLLDYTKFSSSSDADKRSTLDLSEDTFTLSKMLNQLVDISQRASKDDVDLVYMVHPVQAVHEEMVGDYFRIRQCLINLLDNAIKYCSSTVKLSITVQETRRLPGDDGYEGGGRCSSSGGSLDKAEADDGSTALDVVFSILDDGAGIPVERQKMLFVPFQQPTTPNSDQQKQGTGLGLVITKSIAEAMGGVISLESGPAMRGGAEQLESSLLTALESAWFHSTLENLSSHFLVSNFAFKWVNLYRYCGAGRSLT